MLDNQNGNDLIAEYIKDNKIFAVSRLGIGESGIVYNRFKNGVFSERDMYLLRKGGDYGHSYENFYENYVEGLKCADLQVVWVGSHILNQSQETLLSAFSPNSVKIGSRSIEPFYFDNPWSKELKGKKVLVISSFIESIKSQYENRSMIWDNGLLPDFTLIPYESVQSIGGNGGPHNSWAESLQIMKDDISNLDFDIALLSCGHYGLPLVAHIKEKLNKSAIYIGGGLQIMFGIKGARWDSHEEISKMYNKYWVRPMKQETPHNHTIVEGGCYW